MKFKSKICAWCSNPYLDKAHVPGKFLIPSNERNIKNWPILPACKKCNQDLKLDEEWFVLHFSSMLSGYSEIANRIFSTNIKKHLQHSPSIADKYSKRLKLVNLKINGKDLGIKTKLEITDEDWKRINHVIDMYARGLYYWHTNKTAKDLRSKIVYLNPDRFKKFASFIKKSTIVELFPITFEYSYVIRKSDDSAIFFFLIYNKPSFVVTLVNKDKYQQMENKIKSGEIITDKKQFIEILG